MTETKKTLLILGGASDVGRAAAQAFAGEGWNIRLAGRDEIALGREAADIVTRTGAQVSTHRFDALDTSAHVAFVDGLPELPDVVICVVGLLGDQRQAETDINHAVSILRSNFEGPALALGVFAERFAERASGAIVGVSSVAGDRGRASNYAYGSAKSGFTAFLSGLRNRLAKQGVAVITVKPGFIRTKMISHLKTPDLLTASPEEVGNAILYAVKKKRAIVYVKPIWYTVMLVIRNIPEVVFMRLRL